MKSNCLLQPSLWSKTNGFFQRWPENAELLATPEMCWWYAGMVWLLLLLLCVLLAGLRCRSVGLGGLKHCVWGVATRRPLGMAREASTGEELVRLFFLLAPTADEQRLHRAGAAAEGIRSPLQSSVREHSHRITITPATGSTLEGPVQASVCGLVAGYCFLDAGYYLLDGSW